MAIIDMHDYYPGYPKGNFVEVPDEVAAALDAFQREDIAHQVRTFRYKAYFSLDAHDGIEQAALAKPETPEGILEREYDKALLWEAIYRLPEKQARRIYARFMLGRSFAEIARAEGRRYQSIVENIDSALLNLKTFLKS